jgi:hypothetical protein
MPGNTRILSSKDIDRDKWDACVDAFPNGLIYSRFDYLQHTCTNWSAVVIDDYKALMPMPWRSKFGIRYIYQPAFIQQLGLIGAENIDSSIIFSFAKYGDIMLNFGNELLADTLQATARTNQVIDLSKGYEAIASRYQKDLVSNLKKARNGSLYLSKGDDIDLAVKMYQLLYGDRMSNISGKDYANFARLARTLAAHGMCFTRKVEDDKGTLLAIGLFLSDKKRIYNLMNSTTDEGRKKEANHFLMDAVIQEFAGHPLIFDFEGSDIPGVHVFYDKFGTVDQPYYAYHYNHLPPLLKLFKR